MARRFFLLLVVKCKVVENIKGETRVGVMDYVVLIATLGTVVFSWAHFLFSKNREDAATLEREEIEERILELMGKFRYLSANRLEILERKTQELRELIKEANELIAKLSVKLSEVELEVGKVATFSVVNSTEERKGKEEASGVRVENVEESLEDANLERKIVVMHDRGLSEIDIAKNLGISVGEVRLILELFKRNVG